MLSALWFDTGRRGRRPGSPRTGGGLGLFGEGWVVGTLWFDAPLAPTSPTGHVVRLPQHTNDGGYAEVSSRERERDALDRTGRREFGAEGLDEAAGALAELVFGM